ncbi:MAG TPA: sugar phosphate nucleotidyltransferase [Solirubrobacterales bacterium]
MSSRAVILAGGKGSRLSPYTTVLPKPLLPIGDRAILDVVVRQLAGYGFHDLTLAVGYLSHLIKAVMGDGSEHGVRIEYHEEGEPLGTVGPLATIDGLEDTFLAMNGDVLTSLDYSHLIDAHRKGGHALTIASHQRTVHIDYGVLRVDDLGDGETNPIVGFEEKPELPYVVSMGVYAFEPRALDLVEPGTYSDIPDLVLKLIDAGESVGSYLFDGYWLDIGRHDDYELAIEQYEELKPMLLKEEPTATTEPTS